MSTKIEYEVNPNGEVKIRGFRDTPDYTIKFYQVDKLPFAVRGGGRWNALTRTICHLPVGKWHIFDNFANKDELRRARQHLYRRHQFVQDMLGDNKKIEAVSNLATLKLAARIVEIE
jgi:hypothetical protein